MNQIARCDWLPERARWSYFPLSQIINPLSTKLFGSRWLDIDKSKRDIDFVLFCELMDLDSVSVYKLAKKTISSHLDLMLGE